MKEEYQHPRKGAVLLFIALVLLLAKALLTWSIPYAFYDHYRRNPPIPGCDFTMFTILAVTDFILVVLILLMNRFAWVGSIITDMLLLTLLLPDRGLCDVSPSMQLLVQSLIIVTLIHIFVSILLVPHVRDKFSWIAVR
ncbi:MAG: hypothetical protein ACW968_16860 [Candidatus Thorarchaeota archaeon]